MPDDPKPSAAQIEAALPDEMELASIVDTVARNLNLRGETHAARVLLHLHATIATLLAERDEAIGNAKHALHQAEQLTERDNRPTEGAVMTNRERAKDIWRAYAVHCSSVKLQETIETALDEAERRSLTERERLWLAEIDRLRTIIAWCRPRLMHDYYRGALDKYLSDPTLATNADHTKIVQSGSISDQPKGLS